MRSPHPPGVAALFTIVVIAAAGFLLAYGATLLGIGELESGYVGQQGNEALSAADGCAEEQLRQLRLDPAYTAAGATLSLPNGSCTIDVTNNPPSGADKRIEVLSTIGDHHRKVRVDIDQTADPVNGELTTLSVVSWEERTE